MHSLMTPSRISWSGALCVAFSPWQGLNRVKSKDPSKHRKMREDEVVHLRLLCHLCEKQMKAGRHLLHEHPAQADSWSASCIKEVLELEGVDSIEMRQCQFGQSDEIVVR